MRRVPRTARPGEARPAPRGVRCGSLLQVAILLCRTSTVRPQRLHAAPYTARALHAQFASTRVRVHRRLQRVHPARLARPWPLLWQRMPPLRLWSPERGGGASAAARQTDHRARTRAARGAWHYPAACQLAKSSLFLPRVLASCQSELREFKIIFSFHSLQMSWAVVNDSRAEVVSSLSFFCVRVVSEILNRRHTEERHTPHGRRRQFFF